MSGDEPAFGFSVGQELVPIKVYYVFGYILYDYAVNHLIASYKLTQEDDRTTVKNRGRTSDLNATLVMNGIIKEKWEDEYVAGPNFDKFVKEIKAL